MGVGRGLRVEVEVLNDERTSTPAVVKDLYNGSPTCCCPLSLARFKRCDLLVDVKGFHPIAITQREYSVVL